MLAAQGFEWGTDITIIMMHLLDCRTTPAHTLEDSGESVLRMTT